MDTKHHLIVAHEVTNEGTDRAQLAKMTVGEDGFDYRAARYASLSRIAREITGTRWSGPLFFGLRKAGDRAEVSTDER